MSNPTDGRDPYFDFPDPGHLAAEWEAFTSRADGAAPPEGSQYAEAIRTILAALETVVTPEFRRQWEDALLHLLIALRDLLNWSIERLENKQRGQVEVEDIPIG